MTIGKHGDVTAFESLSKLRDEVGKELDLIPNTLELSMGMSEDFDKAVPVHPY